MNQNQEIKMDLLKEFSHVENPVSFCREAYKFLTEDGQMPMSPSPIVFKGDAIPEDGIYLIYDDNSYRKFDKGCKKEGIKYVGIIHNRHAFSVALKDLGVFQLLKDDVECEEESDFYLSRECDALNDWECVKRTSRIQELGTDIPLKKCEYIPAIPMVVAMCYWANRGLNDALEIAGGKPLCMNSYYWSVTEYGSGGAWTVYFGVGTVTTYYKSYGNSVRPVAAFPL